MIQIHWNGADGVVSAGQLLTAGMQETAEVSFTFSPEWDGLTRYAVFAAGDTEVCVPLEGDSCRIPWECLQAGGHRLRIGAYGTGADNLVLPTVWCEVGMILPGVPTDAQLGNGAQPTLGDRLTAQMGVLDKLDTREKSSLVAAVNEVNRLAAQSAEAGFSPIATVQKAGTAATITITDAQGTTEAVIFDGAAGETGPQGAAGSAGAPGFSPTATVVKTGGVATICITDAEGSTQATVSDGAPGVQGPAGEKGEKGDPGTAGSPGDPGAPGFSPSASVVKTGSVATVRITDQSGVTEAVISDGAPGEPGTPGAKGEPGDPGAPGFSPLVSLQTANGIATLSITDQAGTTEASVLAAQPGEYATAAALAAHVSGTDNPHGVIQAQLGAADYVVGQGITGMWSWRKWDSGVAECWGTETITTGEWGGSPPLYYWAGITAKNYPADLFTSVSSVNLTTTSGGGGMVIAFDRSGCSASFCEPGFARAYGGNDALTVKYCVNVMGRWKA